MLTDMKCHRCGGDLVDASPVEIYCPNDECWEEDMKLIKKALRLRVKQDELKELQRLREKYPDVS